MVGLLPEILDFDGQEGRLADVGTSVVLTCLFAVQQLAVEPVPAFVDQAVSVRATSAAAEIVPGLEVTVEFPDGTRRPLGTTDAQGTVNFVAETAGPHVFSATIGGVRCVASVAFRAARKSWMLALVCVPLGLALLWVHLRRLFASSRRA